MKFSLILATLNRKTELNEFLKSLLEQKEVDFELIIVDQNRENFIDEIIEKYKEYYKILHIKTKYKGLSRARNLGINNANGDIIAFPDDDCIYPVNILKKIEDLFIDKNVDGITGIVRNFEGKICCGNFDSDSGYIDIYNCWKRSISITIFLKRYVLEKTGYFNELLGVGSGTKWGAGEETDYIIRSLKNGYKIYYSPSIYIYHPESKDIPLKKILSYNRGMGKVMKINNYSLWFKIYYLLRSIGGALLSLLKLDFKKFLEYIISFLGRLEGLLEE